MNVKDLEKMTVAQLKEELTKKGHPSEGKKAELVKRLAEVIQKAEEDAILNLDSDVPAVASDDLLKDADALLGDDTSKEAIPENTVSEVAHTETGKHQITAPGAEDKEVQIKRAQRFGLPVGTDATEDPKKKRAERFGIASPVTASNTDEAKAKRAERFGISTTAAVTDEVKAKRAERFGITATENTGSPAAKGAVVDEATKERLLKRAARFGIPVSADGKTLATDAPSDEVLAKRSARFGSGDAEAEAKKKARMERFAASN